MFTCTVDLVEIHECMKAKMLSGLVKNVDKRKFDSSFRMFHMIELHDKPVYWWTL